MFNGEILSYVISESPNLKMVMDMLNQLYDNIESTEGMLMHSDQGWHYQHAAYQRSLKNHHISYKRLQNKKRMPQKYELFS